MQITRELSIKGLPRSKAWALKLGLVILWPVIAVCLVTGAAIISAIAWVVIPFLKAEDLN